MAPTDATSSYTPAPPPQPLEIEQCEAALIEHYSRLVRIGYLVLPPTLGRQRRVLTAHALAQRALPRGRITTEVPPVPGQRAGGSDAAPAADPGYAYLRVRVVRAALAADRPRRSGRRRSVPRVRAQLPPLLPRVLGLRLAPRSGGAAELALDQALAGMSGPARAGYVLRALEGLADPGVLGVLTAVGVRNPGAALAEADRVQPPAGSADRPLLESADFDPCSLQARPTDLLRRRQHVRAAVIATVALAVCALLLGVPSGAWGPDGAAAPPYARNAAAQQALDPGLLTRAAPTAWKQASHTGFSVWPARGDLAEDQELLRRALAMWARPGEQVRVSATPGTQAGPAAGPPQLLYAGEVGGAAVVLLHDGLRAVRYAEPKGADRGGVALDFARTDAADAASASALVVGRSPDGVRYLTAPWVTRAAVTDLLKPSDRGRPLPRNADGVTAPVPGPPVTGQAPSGTPGAVPKAGSGTGSGSAPGAATPSAPASCAAWPAMLLTVPGHSTPHLLTDLGELAPARLTHGVPGAAPRDAVGDAARARLARTACHLPALAGTGVRSVNVWPFAAQSLPGGAGTAQWLCTRGETWRGTGGRAITQFLTPGSAAPARRALGAPAAVGRGPAPGAVTASADNGPECSARDQRVLTGVLWRSKGGRWYLLAAGSDQVRTITATGGVRGTSLGRKLAIPAPKDARPRLTGELTDGGKLAALG